MGHPVLRAEGLVCESPDGRELLSSFTGSLEIPDRLALCGPNGAGKSTLLALLAGRARARSGRFHKEGLAGPTVLLPQEDPAGGGSPGERRRAALDAVLRDPGGWLLLDEPTNHLDATALRDLEARLRRVRVPVLLVSHDRALIERFAEATWWLEDGRLEVASGGFERAWRARQVRMGAVLEAREAHDREVGALRERLERSRERVRSRERDVSAGSRMKDRHDSDARGIGAGNLARWGQSAGGRRVRREADRLERLEGRELAPVRRDTLRDVAFAWEPDPSARWSLPAGTVRRGDRALFGHDGILLPARGRVRLEGGNGAGKTTLLEALAASRPRGAFLLPQDDPPGKAEAFAARLREGDSARRGRILSLAAALGASGASLRASTRPSPGELRKLRLAEGLAGGHAGLFLDEPTNHLDAPSIRRLQEALEAWPGALLLVTHDRALAEALALGSWRLEGGRLRS